MVSMLDAGAQPIGVEDDFLIRIACDGCASGYSRSGSANQDRLVGKKLGVWIVEEDIYFTLTFNSFGQEDDYNVSYTRTTPK